MLWIPHQLVGAPLGYSVTLECYTEAHPTSLNYWAREDGLMIHESSKYRATSSPDRPSYKTHMTLTISDIQVSTQQGYSSPPPHIVPAIDDDNRIRETPRRTAPRFSQKKFLANLRRTRVIALSGLTGEKKNKQTKKRVFSFLRTNYRR